MLHKPANLDMGEEFSTVLIYQNLVFFYIFCPQWIVNAAFPFVNMN